MEKWTRALIAAMVFALGLGFPAPGFADVEHGPRAELNSLKPEDTVILSNGGDARFSTDYSVLLKHLRLDWLILNSPVLPESVTEKNLVIIGHPDAEYSGDLMSALLTEEEIEYLRSAIDHHIVLEKESPWMDGRTIFLCSGADLLLARNAAEEAMRGIIAAAADPSDWIRTTYEPESSESARDFAESLQYLWFDDELPVDDLAIDVEADSRSRISSQEAGEDVERLFSIFSHGYSGYAFFNQQGEFEHARTGILSEIVSRDSWSSDAFAALLSDHLSFINDCHMRIGEHQFCQRSDFWYDTEMELVAGRDGYRFVIDDKTYSLSSINGADPQSYLFPSLNSRGEPIYRMGILSIESPQPLLVKAEMGGEELEFEIDLHRSDFDYFSDDLFDEGVLGGIPVVRIRSFTDAAPEELNSFVATGSRLRGDPVVIIDLRGNSGGNEHWPVSWIQRLTGSRAESVLIRSELVSKTSMMGRANAFEYWDHVAPGSSLFRSEADRYAGNADGFEAGRSHPRWTGTTYPRFSLIPNETTVIVITNNQVASAGEGMVMRISRLDNVVVVGENSMGALTFGNVSTHQLPNSGLMVWLSINFNLFPDQQIREGVGLSPDLWVPAADAVNYTVAAVRRGTITTSQPLSPDILSQEFLPENPYAREQQELLLSLLVVAGIAAGGLVWAFFMRQNPRMVVSFGGVWAIFGSVLTVLERQPLGWGLLVAGILCLLWGGINLLGGKRAAVQSEG